jgi:hypothetical protein
LIWSGVLTHDQNIGRLQCMQNAWSRYYRAIMDDKKWMNYRWRGCHGWEQLN